MRFLKLVFSSNPPGAIRGSLEPFLILATSYRVIQDFKQLLCYAQENFMIKKVRSSSKNPLKGAMTFFARVKNNAPHNVRISGAFNSFKSHVEKAEG